MVLTTPWLPLAAFTVIHLGPDLSKTCGQMSCVLGRQAGPLGIPGSDVSGLLKGFGHVSIY